MSRKYSAQEQRSFGAKLGHQLQTVKADGVVSNEDEDEGRAAATGTAYMCTHAYADQVGELFDSGLLPRVDSDKPGFRRRFCPPYGCVYARFLASIERTRHRRPEEGSMSRSITRVQR